MKENLQILHLEDDDLDAEIIKNILKEEGIECSITRASCKKEYFSTIHQNDYDIILADNSLPDYNGISALKYAKEHKPQIPFIFVSGTIGEDRAVEALRFGAKDYVLKQHLSKLAPAIERVMHEVETEQASKENEDKYRSFFENSMDAILLVTPDGNIIQANPAACRMFGYSEEELIKVGRSGITDMTNHRLYDFLSVRKLKGKVQGELTYYRKDGTHFPGEFSSSIFKVHEGLECISTIIRDITERKLAEETLRVNNERYKKSQKIGRVGSWEYDIENGSFWGSDEAKRIYGCNSGTYNFSAEDVMKCIIERDGVNQARIDLIEKNEPYNIVYDIIPSNSSEKKTINSIAELFRDENGNPVKITGVFQDITDRKHAEEALKENEKKYRELYDNAPVGYHELDLQGRITRVNCTELNMLGYTKEEMIGQFVWKFSEDEDASQKRVLDKLKGIIPPAKGKESVYRRKNSTKLPVLLEEIILRNAADNIIGIRTTIQDISERKQAEEALRKSEEKFKSIFEGSNDAIMLLNEKEFIDCNPQTLKIFGINSKEEFLKLHPSDFSPPNQLDGKNSFESSNEKIRTAYQQGMNRFNWIHRRSNGEDFHTEVLLSAFNLGSEQVLQATVRDISERKRAEENLHALSVRQEAILSAIPDIIMEVDNSKIYTWANKAGIDFFGDDVIGKKVDFYFEGIQDTYDVVRPLFLGDENIIYIESLQRRKDGEKCLLAWWCRVLKNSSGNVVGALSSARDITEKKKVEEVIRESEERFRMIFENVFDGISIYREDPDPSMRKLIECNERYSILAGRSRDELLQLGNTTGLQITLGDIANVIRLESLDRGKAYQGFFSWIRPDGKENVIEYVGMPITWRGEAFTIGIDRDITERKRTEKELIVTKEKAEESDKIKSEFLAQMSHEIRTPLNAIVGNVDYLNESFGEKMDSDTRDCFDSINLASKRIIRTVDLILNVAELQTSGYKPRFVKVDLNSEILNKLYQEHQLSAKQKGIELIFTCIENDTKVIVDEYSITQIFANLIDNAIKYTKKGKVEILLGKNSTGNIMVEIKDTGIGMSKEFLPELFEPFVQEVHGFSRTYDGNGLGLALVKKYCEINNKSIEVESEKNVGSTFRVIFDNKD
jgi:PAS domain S-box-containing protein